MPSFYRREVLQRALDIVWRKKYLWFIGLFAGLATYGGEGDILFRNFGSIDSLQHRIVVLRQQIHDGQVANFFHQLRDLFTHHPSTAFSYLAIVVLLAAVFVWLVIVSQAAIIRIVGRTAEKKASGIFDGLATGTEKFWPILLVNIIAKLLTWALWVVLAGIPATVYFLRGNFAWAVIMSLGWFAVTVPLSIIISFLTKYATAYITLEDHNANQALRQGWKLFADNWLVSLEIAGLVYIFNLVVSFLVTAVAVYSIQPYSWFGLSSLLFVLALELAFLSAFSYSAWTFVFLKLVEGKAESKIGRWTTRLVDFAAPKKAV
ncbi:MAG: hypothetical protein HY092_02990 [Candidatus Kerfeldbacteria bacterium]|nr:hypothetical protein [Candidatus Kerfeldbacteria bacterium]